MRVFLEQEKKDQIQKTEPINDIKKATLFLNINGKPYNLEFITDGNHVRPKPLQFDTNYGHFELTITSANFYFVKTFENLLLELQNSGITISRSPVLDLVPGNDDKFFAIVFDGIGYDKSGKQLAEHITSRIVLINKEKVNQTLNLDFYLNNMYVDSIKLSIIQKPVSVDQAVTKEENQILVYPNPASPGSYVNIEYLMPQKGEYFLELYDIQGNKVCLIDVNYSQGKNEEGIFTLKLPEGLSPGPWLLVLKNKEQKTILSSKIIVE